MFQSTPTDLLPSQGPCQSPDINLINFLRHDLKYTVNAQKPSIVAKLNTFEKKSGLTFFYGNVKKRIAS